MILDFQVTGYEYKRKKFWQGHNLNMMNILAITLHPYISHHDFNLKNTVCYLMYFTAQINKKETSKTRIEVRMLYLMIFKQM